MSLGAIASGESTLFSATERLSLPPDRGRVQAMNSPSGSARGASCHELAFHACTQIFRPTLRSRRRNAIALVFPCLTLAMNGPGALGEVGAAKRTWPPLRIVESLVPPWAWI